MRKDNQAASGKATQPKTNSTIITKKSKPAIHEEGNEQVHNQLLRAGLEYCKDPKDLKIGQFIRSKFYLHEGDGFTVKERKIDFIAKTESGFKYIKTAAASTKSMGTSIRRHYFYCFESEFPMIVVLTNNQKQKLIQDAKKIMPVIEEMGHKFLNLDEISDYFSEVKQCA